MKNFEKQTFTKRLKSMLKVDLRRLFTTRLFYIMLGIALVIPILVLVMTTMMDGSVTVDPQTGVETVIEGFDNAWHSIATVSTTEQTMSMDLTSMCNINMIYFIVAVFVCMFIAEDFRSGFSKLLFVHRSKKTDYVISKTIVSFITGALMIIMWTLGTVIGGAISGLPFDLETAGITGLLMCLLSKILLIGVFASIFILVSVAAKQKLWLSLIGSFMIGMLLFMMIPALTPLDSGITNVIICLIASILFSTGLGSISNIILKKTDLL